MPGTPRRCTPPARSGTGGGTHIHTGVCRGRRDDKPVAHRTNRAPKENHQFSRRIPVNAAKRTDRKKMKKGKRSTYRAEAPAIAEPVQERSILAYNGAQTMGPPTRWTPQRHQVEPDGT
ncbi:unnamed protein product [Sphagnum troendelagicum]